METHVAGYSMVAQVDPSVRYVGNVSYSGLHMTLECRDAKLWPIVSGCITMSLVSALKRESQHTVQQLREQHTK